MELFPDACALIGGLAVAFSDYLLMKKAVDRPEKMSLFLILRTLLAAVFVAALYFIAAAAGLKLIPFMISGAVGLTIGLAITTFILMKRQKARKDE